MTSSYTDSFDYLNSDLSSRYFVDSLAPTRSSLASLDADLTTNADSLPTGAFLEFSRVLKSRHIPGPVVLFTSNPEHLLGSGAQFSVYTGTLFIYPEASQRTDSFPNELVAVKIPHFHIDAGEHLSLASPKFQRQLHDMLLEILVHGHPALSRHRNIARLVAWGKDMRGYHNMPCLAFELALGDLGRTLRGMKELAFETRLGLSCDVGAGLDAIHEFGIIHGDLKPANILVFPSGTGFVAKLADFGLSMDEAKEEYTKPPGGTPGWQAPEVGRYFEDGGLVLTSELPGTDTYSFGLLVWSVMLLNGDPPQNGVGDRTAVAVSKAFSRLRESVGQSKVDMLEKAVQSFLSPLAKDRPKSIGNLLGGEPIP